MTDTRMDKEKLAAFVDGALEPEAAAAVVMHLADCPADQAYVDDLMALNEALGQAYAEPMGEPAPARIRETIMGVSSDDVESEAPVADERVVPLRRPNAAAPRRSVIWGGAGALAAGIAAFAILFDTRTGAPTPFLDPGPLVQRSAVGVALTELASGEARLVGEDVEIGLIASFRTPGRGVCREFEVIRESGALHDHGVACPHDEAGWSVEAIATSRPSSPDLAFTPASGFADDPVTRFLDEVDAGQVLGPDDEEAARASDWR